MEKMLKKVLAKTARRRQNAELLSCPPKRQASAASPTSRASRASRASRTSWASRTKWAGRAKWASRAGRAGWSSGVTPLQAVGVGSGCGAAETRDSTSGRRVQGSLGSGDARSRSIDGGASSGSGSRDGVRDGGSAFRRTPRTFGSWLKPASPGRYPIVVLGSAPGSREVNQ